MELCARPPDDGQGLSGRPLGKLTLGIGTHRFALADVDRGNRNNNIDNNYRWTIPVALHNVNAGVKITVQLFEAIRPATGKTRPRRARRSWISSSGPTR